MNETTPLGTFVATEEPSSVYMETARWKVECASDQTFIIVAQTFKDASALASAMAEENRTEVLSVTHLGEDETVYDWRR